MAKVGKSKSNGPLERDIAKTHKLQISDLLEVYKTYDELVMDTVYRRLLLPFTRISRDWVLDQAREVFGGTDRNRLIMTARSRKAREADVAEWEPSRKLPWKTTTKTKYMEMVFAVTNLCDTLPWYKTIPNESLRELGLTRAIYDDIGMWVTSISSSYPAMTAEYCSAMASGDLEEALTVRAQMISIEEEVGVRTDHAWYVFLNTIATYDQIDEIVSFICTGFMRLLFRYSHGLRGITGIEENFSTGYEGLIRATRNYDPLDGSAFTIHSQFWIRSAILQRQRQTSVIALPSTTWYQLNQIAKGTGDFSDEKVNQIKERAEMFYAHSQNGLQYDMGEEDVDPDYSATLVTSPDAYVVLGDGLTHTQDMEYIESQFNTVDKDAFVHIAETIAEISPNLLFSITAWALREGIDISSLIEGIGNVHSSSETVARTEALAQVSKLKLANLSLDSLNP